MVRVLCKWFGERHPWSATTEAEFSQYLSKSPLVETVSTESNADIIIVFNKHLTPVGRFDLRLLMSSYYQKHRDKILIYDETDVPLFVIPGLYVSTNLTFMGAHILPVPYINLATYAFTKYNKQYRPIKCSFWGRDSHKVRSQLYAIDELGYSINNTSNHDFFNMNPDNQSNLLQHKISYCEILGSSMYSLCPRGYGTSSIRLYESIYAGCVPVIISDNYVPPFNVDWYRCALLVKESKVSDIVNIVNNDLVNYAGRKAMIEDASSRILQPSAVTEYIINNRTQSTVRETYLRFFSQVINKTFATRVQKSMP